MGWHKQDDSSRVITWPVYWLADLSELVKEEERTRVTIGFRFDRFLNIWNAECGDRSHSADKWADISAATWILASDWLRLITWPKYWSLIGWECWTHLHDDETRSGTGDHSSMFLSQKPGTWAWILQRTETPLLCALWTMSYCSSYQLIRFFHISLGAWILQRTETPLPCTSGNLNHYF